MVADFVREKIPREGEANAAAARSGPLLRSRSGRYEMIYDLAITETAGWWQAVAYSPVVRALPEP